MSESTTFLKDGMKRLFKNKLAMLCLMALIFITLIVIFVPMIYLCPYEEQLEFQNSQSQILLIIICHLGIRRNRERTYRKW